MTNLEPRIDPEKTSLGAHLDLEPRVDLESSLGQPGSPLSHPSALKLSDYWALFVPGPQPPAVSMVWFVSSVSVTQGLLYPLVFSPRMISCHSVTGASKFCSGPSTTLGETSLLSQALPSQKSLSNKCLHSRCLAYKRCSINAQWVVVGSRHLGTH